MTMTRAKLRWLLHHIEAARMGAEMEHRASLNHAFARKYGLSGLGPARRCQYIEGDPGRTDDCKCNKPSVRGFSWCAKHLGICAPQYKNTQTVAP